MVTATVSNSPVSITLKENESVTVPSGEVWKVTISIGLACRCEINNVRISGTYYSDEPNVIPVETVLVGGDTVKNSYVGANSNIHIGGFVVN